MAPSGWQVLFPGPELTADLRAMDQRRPDCALAHEVDDAVAARVGRGIPGQECASRLAAVPRWYRDGQRDRARLRAVICGQPPGPALERAARATAGDPDRTERVASLPAVFAGSCRDNARPGRAPSRAAARRWPPRRVRSSGIRGLAADG
ncbi:MAG: hypothetical protein ABSB59_44140 [Streptosporangiaceae bacterium]